MWIIVAYAWAYIRCVLVLSLCVCVSPPSQWVGSVLLVLVQWARPCIRQVELQGKFCNTWPVSLTRLCGWRKGGKEKEGESKRKDWMAAQVVRGDWKHEWQWSRKGGGTAAGASWAGRVTWDDGAFTFLLSYFPRLCVSHPSLCLYLSFSSLSGRPGRVAPLLITQPFNLKGQKQRLCALKVKNITFLCNYLVLCTWLCICDIPSFSRLSRWMWLFFFKYSMPAHCIHINSLVFHLRSSAGGLLPWRKTLSCITASLATYFHSVLSFLLSSNSLCVCLFSFAFGCNEYKVGKNDVLEIVEGSTDHFQVSFYFLLTLSDIQPCR